MIRRAAASFDIVEGEPPAAVLCVHALDDADLPLCRGVKREDLTDSDVPWEKWREHLRCEECQRRSAAGN